MKFSKVLLLVLAVGIGQLPLFAQVCAVNAGTDQTICANGTLTLTGVAGSPQSSPPAYEWSEVSGPGGAVITSPGTLVTTVTGFTPGNYTFRLRSRCSDYIYAQDLVSVTVLPPPPTSVAGSNVSICTSSAVTLNANPATSPYQGTWTSSGGGTFSNVNSPTSTYTPPATRGTYTLTWTISNGTCSSASTMTVTVVMPAAVSAGANSTLSCSGSCKSLSGSNPGLAPQTGLWTLVSGPNTPVFSAPTSANTNVCNLVPGLYQFRWSVNGACLTGSSTVQLNVQNTNTTPTVASGTRNYTNVCSTPGSSTQVLIGTPLAAGETGAWTLTSGGAGAAAPVFSPDTATAGATVSNLTGTFPYNFRWTKTNTATGCSANETHIIYRSALVSNLSQPADINLNCGLNTTTFTVSYTDASDISSTTTRSGTRLSGPGTAGTLNYTSTSATGGIRTDVWTAINMTQPGSYVYRLNYVNACGAQYRDIVITANQTPGLVNAGSSIVLPCNQLTASPIGSTSTTLTGYNVAWTQVSGPNTAAISGANTLAPTLSGLIKGVYRMRLNVAGGANCSIVTDEMLITASQSAPTVATTGSNATICYGSYQLTANVPQPDEKGAWTVSPSAGVVFSDASSPFAKVSGLQQATTYTFTWTVSNACGSINSSQVLTTSSVASPPMPELGSDICVTTTSFPASTTLNGTAPGSATPLWTALDANASVNTPAAQNTTASMTGAGSYRFKYQLSKTGCQTLSDTVVVTASPAITATASSIPSVCAASFPYSNTLSGSYAPAVSGITTTWSQLSGPAIATINNPAAGSTGVSVPQSGIYEFIYRVSLGACVDKTATVKYEISQRPTTANAGPDQAACDIVAGTGTGSSLTLAGNTPVYGSGYWTINTAPPAAPAATFSDFTSPTSTIRSLVQGQYSLIWTIINGNICAASTDTVLLDVSARASAGSNFNLCTGSNTTLTGNANTDGTWTLTNKSLATLPDPVITNDQPLPNTAVISNIATPITANNAYTFRYSIPGIGSCPASTSDVTVTVYPKPSVADAGPDIELCPNQSSATLTATIPVYGSVTWSKFSGPANNTPTFGSANSTSTSISNLVAGIYTFRASVNTSGCTATLDDVNVIKEDSANAGADIRVCNINSITLNATPTVVNTGTWSLVSASAGNPAITNVNAPNTAVTGLVPGGTYVFRWTVSSSVASNCGANTDDVAIIVDAPVSGVSAGTNQSFCQGKAASFAIGAAAQSGIVYSWTPASFLSNAAVANPNFTGVNNSGSFQYTLKSVNGSCEAYNYVTVTMNPTPTALIRILSPGCTPSFGAETAGTGVNNPVYAWNFGSNASPSTYSGIGPVTVSYPNSGTNTANLTVTSSDGCTAAASITGTSCFTLPVKLENFTAQWNGNAARLRWEASTPVNFHHFEIERSYTGTGFSKLAEEGYKVSGKYEYTDGQPDPSQPKVYYRLRMVDNNGSYTLSPVRSLTLGATGTVTVTPVPFSDRLNLTFRVSEPASVVSIRLMNATGSVIRRINKYYGVGNVTEILTDLGNLPSGFYTVETEINGKSTVNKVIKL